jgi:hypothetical protein
MSEVTHQEGGAPIQEKPFPNNPGEGEPTDPRTAAIDDISDKFEAQRLLDRDEAIAADPGLAAKQKEMDDALDRENDAARAAGLLDPDQAADKVASTLDDGAAGREAMHQPQEQVKPALPTELQDDPLAEYIDMVDGRPMFRSKVDGQIIHTDLDTVRVTQQKHEAADRRLQQASEWQKDLQQREQAFATQQAAPVAQPMISPPSDLAAVDDLDINAVSKDIVASMFKGTEDEAAEKLADTLGRIARRPAQAVSQPIDADALVNRATAAARESVQQERYTDDVNEAWGNFTTDFKDVHDDPEAFTFADSLTGGIEQAHPDWKPAQVMMEAGRRAREVVINPRKQLAELNNPLPPANDADRQNAKSNLVPIPQARVGTQEPVPEERPQTPSEALAEIRASRNQPG